MTGWNQPQSSWLVPSAVRQAYGFNSIPAFSVNGQSVAADGSGQTIAIVDAFDDPSIFGDLAAFDNQFGLADPPSFQVIGEYGLNGTLPKRAPQGSNIEVETAGDVEWAHAMAPGANILLVEANSMTNADIQQAALTAATFPGVSVVSISYLMDPNKNPGLADYPKLLSATGVTFVGISGDNGYFIYPMAGPGALIVGGTQLSVNSDNSYGGESTWFQNPKANSSTGGGIYPEAPAGVPATPIPSWQANQWARLRIASRISPDVAYAAINPAPANNNAAGDGFAVFDSWDYQANTNISNTGSWINFYGTSAGAPQWAALIAIANQGRALELPARGPLNGLDPTLPMLYSLPSGDFHQIPVSTDSDGHIVFDTTGAGKYVVGGLGSPRAERIIPDLVKPFQGYYSQVVDNIEPVNGNATVVNGQLVVYGSAGPAASDQISLSYSTNLDGNQLLTVTDNGTSDSFDLTTFSSVVINCRAAADTVTVQMTPAGYPPIGITVEGGQGSDNLVVDDTANPAATNYTVTDSTVRRTYAGVVNFSSIEDVKINGGGGDSDYHVQYTDSNSSTEIYTGDGLDHVYVEGTQGPLTVNLGSNPNDTVELSPVAQSLDNLGGGVGVNGTVVNGASQGTLILDDQNTPLVSTTNPDKTVTFTVDGGSPAGSGSVTRTEQVQGVSSTLTLGYTNLAKLVINGGNTGNTFDVQSTDAGTPVTITAGTGQDRIDIGGATAETLDPIQGALTFNGQGASTTLNVDDENTASHEYYQVYDTQVTRTPYTYGQPYGSPTQTINFFNLGSVNVHGGSAADLFDVYGTVAGTSVALYGGSSGAGLSGGNALFVNGPDDTVNGIHGPVAIHGGSIYDLAVVVDALDTVGHTYTVTATDVKRDDLADITYDGVGELTVSAADTPYSGHRPLSTVNVLSTAAHTFTGVLGGKGDTINLGMPTGIGSAPTLQDILGPLEVSTGAESLGTGTVVVDDSGDPNARQVTYQTTDFGPTELSGLAGPTANPTPVYLNLGATASVSLLGGSGTNALTATFPGDFTQSWNVSGFASSSFSVPGNFGGSLFAQALGTAAQPIQQIQIGGSMTAAAKVKVNDLSTLSVGGDLAGTVYGYGNSGSPSRPTIGTVTIGGSFSGTITAPVIGSINQQPASSFSGNASETMPGADFQSLVLGTVTHTAVIDAGAIVSATVVGDMAGQMIVSGPLGTLSVGGNLTGAVSATTIGSISVGGDLSGQVSASQSLGSVGAGGTISGSVAAPTIQQATVNGTATGNDTFVLTPSSVVLDGTTVLSGAFGSLMVHGGAGNDLYQIEGGVVPATIAAGSGNDTFQFFTGSGLTGSLDGGGGANTLDYSQYAGNILVDLLLGSATAVGGGIAHIQQVNGSQGNDLIVGDASPSKLTGGTARNILIGGAGQSTLDASRGTSDNILIGGTTDWDTNLAALEAILAEWDRTDLGFNDRRSDLLNGANGQCLAPLNVVNGQLILLTPATNRTSSNGTVHANAFADTLIGSTASDPATGKRVHNWFLYSLNDVIENDLNSSDRKHRIT
jgi:hypothetical protein